MGLQADGRTPSGDPVLLDVDNLIDYVMITFFAQNRDAPLTAGGDRPNNFFSLRGRSGNRGFIHIQHDGEHSLNTGNADRWGPWASPATSGPWNSITRATHSTSTRTSRRTQNTNSASPTASIARSTTTDR